MSGAAIVAIPFLLYNLSLYDSILPNYYQGSRLEFHSAFLEALLGNLLSPSRGMFFYSPVLLFAIAGVIMRVRAGQWQLFDSLIAVGVVAHWLAISAYPLWWGGYSNGPRFMIDILPFICLWLVYFMRHFDPQSSVLRWGTWFLFALLMLISVFIHFSGATSTETRGWTSVPVNVSWLPERLWDWRDVSFLRPYLRLEEITPGVRVNAYRVEFDARDGGVTAMREWYPTVRTTADGRTYRVSYSPEPSFVLPMETDEARQVSVGLVDLDEPELTENFQLYVNEVQIPLTQTQTDPPVFEGMIPQDVLANRQTITVFDFHLPSSASDGSPARIAVDYVQIGPPGETLPRERRLPD
jgi:hypothetical protein